MPELLFHGAAGEVTGSMHLVQHANRWVALDCGLFQGHRQDTEEKNRRWQIPPAELSAVVVSHAHIDHIGRLPRLVRDGFEGDIFCTPATRDLAAIMLRDSAHIQEEDVHYVTKKRAKEGLPPIEPLYTDDDAVKTMRLMRTIPLNRWFDVGGGVRARYHEAGHILGSAGIELQFGNNGSASTLYFVGDVGGPGKPIINDPAPFPPCDYLICESTYGDRNTSPLDVAKAELFAAVKGAIDRRGKVIVPAFAVGRAQLLVYFLQEWMDAGRLPCIPVYVDSPLAVNATEVFKLHPELWDEAARRMKAKSGDFLQNRCITYIEDVKDSIALNRRHEPCIIISASGMCEAGRIRHHLKNNIQDARNTILIPGYQAEGTLGRRLADGAKRVRFFHQEFDVRAQVVQTDGFSAHADQQELLRFISPLAKSTRQTFLVHGEPGPRTVLRDRLAALGMKVETPVMGQKFAL